MKRLLAIAGAVLALILVALLALPFVIDPNRFRPMLETRLTEALGREVKLGDLKLAILHGSVKGSDLSIADDPAYSRAPFVRAKSLAIGVEVWPLIVSRKLHVTGLVIGEPEIALIQSPVGDWNFSSLGGKAKEQPAKAAATEPPSGTKGDLDLSVKFIRLEGGQLSLGLAGARTRPLTLRDVNIEVKDFSAAAAFPFTLQANVAGGAIHLAGSAGPINSADTAASPLSVNLKIEGLDLTGSGLTQTAPALAGLIAFKGSGQSDGRIAHIKGKLKAEKLRLARAGSPAREPVASSSRSTTTCAAGAGTSIGAISISEQPPPG